MAGGPPNVCAVVHNTSGAELSESTGNTRHQNGAAIG